MNQDVIQPRLSIRQISKSYVGIHALRNIDFDIAAGEIHALVGENGAGKSTLVKIITGVESAESGQLVLDGTECRFHNPMEARANGVLAVYQDPKLFPNLDIAENVFMGIHPKTRLGFVDRKLMYRQTREVLERLGADLDPKTMVVSLSIGQMLFVEFARAMFDAHEKLLLLDEPTASLSPNEANQIFDVVRKLRDRGVSILFISQRIEELFGFADRITILRDGAHVITGRHVEDDPDADRPVHGGPLAERPFRRAPRHREERDAGSGQGRAPRRGADRGSGSSPTYRSPIRPREILGMAGLVGSGRTEIAKAIFGAIPHSSGKVWINDQEVRIKDPSQMIHDGVVYVPEDREVEGLIADLSVVDNMLLPAVVKYARAGFVDGRKKERDLLLVHGTIPDQDTGPAGEDLLPLRRQPAEGRPVKVDGHEPEGLHLRRAHPRDRRRLQGAGSPRDPGAGGPGAGHPPDLLRPPGDPRDV